MLRKKEYTAILESAKSKDEIVALFNSLYSPVPAIRIVREIYHRNVYREYEFSCDKCGHGFVVKAENDPEYNEELCVCPNCGHSISMKTNSYYSPKKLYALDEAYRGYQKVLASSGETVDPSFSVFETVEVEGKRYFIARRLHFKLKQGQINKTRIYRCLIIPEKREDNYAVLYENDIGVLTTSSTEKPGDWFSMYKYNTPGVGKSCMSSNGNISKHTKAGGNARRRFIFTNAAGAEHQVYCVESGIDFTSSNNGYTSSSGSNSRYFQNLPKAAREGIMLTTVYGWQEGLNTPVAGTNNDDYALATQVIIWEYQQLRTSPTRIAENNGIPADRYFKTIQGRPAEKCYNWILEQCAKHLVVPNFSGSTQTLRYDPSGCRVPL